MLEIIILDIKFIINLNIEKDINKKIYEFEILLVLFAIESIITN